MSIKYSVVIPLKNEEGNIKQLLNELYPVMQKVGHPFEVICIDDGSTDETLNILKELTPQKPNLRTLIFDKNYGQSSAFDAGFKNAQGEWIITLDGDLQNDPLDIPRLINISGSYDLICGRRQKRKDPWHKKITSFLANKIRKKLCKDTVQDTGCSLKLYRSISLSKIKMFQGMHRFLPALFSNEGFRVTEIDVNHRERVQGCTKYNLFNRSFNTIADMLAVRWMGKRHLNYKIDQEIK